MHGIELNKNFSVPLKAMYTYKPQFFETDFDPW